MSNPRPYFLITIDTEGDNLWSRPRHIATENARYLSRFQALCESYGFAPTYLTNFEMAMDRRFQQLARTASDRGTAEIGMHLHAWNSPPVRPLTDDDMHHQPFLIEYAAELIDEKVAYMTRLLTDVFCKRPRSHRAGRWSMNAVYLAALERHGYDVDCSVTPHVSHEHQMGDPNGRGGTDYSEFPEHAYFLDRQNLHRGGDSPILELPVTIRPSNPRIEQFTRRLPLRTLVRRPMDIMFPNRPRWLRPNGRNLQDMRALLRETVSEGREYAEFMLHSSEFMPGGSPTFPNADAIENLYSDLEQLFDDARSSFQGGTLAEFYDNFALKALKTAG